MLSIDVETCIEAANLILLLYIEESLVLRDSALSMKAFNDNKCTASCGKSNMSVSSITVISPPSPSLLITTPDGCTSREYNRKFDVDENIHQCSPRRSQLKMSQAAVDHSSGGEVEYCSTASDGSVSWTSVTSSQASNHCQQKESSRAGKFLERTSKLGRLFIRPLQRSRSAGYREDASSTHTKNSLKTQRTQKQVSADTDTFLFCNADPHLVNMSYNSSSESCCKSDCFVYDGNSLQNELNEIGSYVSSMGTEIKNCAAVQASCSDGSNSRMLSCAASDFCDRKKKRSIGLEFREKLSSFARRQADNSVQSKSSTLKDADKAMKRNRPSLEMVQRWGKDFDSLLNDKYGLSLFRGFLRTEFSDENIEFWIACEEYIALNSPKKQLVKAEKIYQEFVAVQAPREINLDSTTRLQTIEALNAPNKHTFENAQKRIQALMERDSYKRFLRSELYNSLLREVRCLSTDCSDDAASSDVHCVTNCNTHENMIPVVCTSEVCLITSTEVRTGEPCVDTVNDISKAEQHQL